MLKRVIYLMFLPVMAMLWSCDDNKAEEPTPPTPPDDEFLYGTPFYDGGFFAIVDGDTIEIVDETFTIPPNVEMFHFDVYSNGLFIDKNVLYLYPIESLSGGWKARVLNPITDWDSDWSKFDIEPVEWRKTSCMANSRSAEEFLMSHLFFKQTIEIYREGTDNAVKDEIEIPLRSIPCSYLWNRKMSGRGNWCDDAYGKLDVENMHGHVSVDATITFRQ